MSDPSLAHFIASQASVAGLISIGLAVRFWRERAQMAARLRTLSLESELARELVDSTSDAVVVVDAELRVIRANKVYLLLNETSSADLAGAPLAGSQGKYPELNKYLQSMLLQMQEHQPDAESAELVRTFLLKNSDESERTFEVRARPYRPEGRAPRGTVIALTDVTEKVAAEAQVDQATAAMDDITSALSLTFAQMRREPTEHVWVPWVKGMVSPYWSRSAGDLLRDGGGVFPNLVGEEKTRFIDAIANSMTAGTPIDIVLFLEPHNRWIRIGTGKPRAQDDGATIWYCYAMDVTEERRHTQLLAMARRDAEAAAETQIPFPRYHEP